MRDGGFDNDNVLLRHHGGVLSFEHGKGIVHGQSVEGSPEEAKVFRCFRALLGKSFLIMAEPKQRVDTGASFRQSKRELFVMIAAWVVTALWVLGYNSQAAYAAETETPVRMLFGLPRWTVIGWLLPLLVANAFTIWFCLRFMRDEPMEGLPEDE